jgi:hypothetical protein
MSFGDRRLDESCDRYITGNYGEDQIQFEECKTCGEEIGTNKDCSECKSYVEACALGEFR